MNNFFSDSLAENLVLALLTAIFIGLVVGLFTPFFVDLQDSVFTFFDKSALIYVTNRYEPFRVGIEMAFLGSFLTFLLLIIVDHWKRNKKAD